MSPSLAELFRFRKPSRLQQLGLIASIAVVGLLMILALRDFDIAALWQRVGAANKMWFTVAILCLIGGQLLRVVRWQRLLVRDQPPELARLAGTLMDGQLINWLSPIRLGDIWRVWRLTAGSQRNVLWTVISIVLEKAADSFVLGLFALILVIAPNVIQLPQTTQGATAGILVRLFGVGLGCLLLTIAGLALRPRTWIARVQARLPATWLEKITPERLQVPTDVRAQLRTFIFWLELFAYTLAIWLLGIGTNVALALALATPLGIGQHLLLLLAFQVGLVLSTVPGNLGIFPLVASGIFSLVGYGVSDGLIFGGILFVIVNGCNVVLWLGYKLLDVAPRPATRPAAGGRTRINGVRVDGETVDLLLARVDAAITNSEHITVMYANAHGVNLAQREPEFMQALNGADLVFCDGFGVHWAARVLGDPLPERMTPPDWIGSFAAHCARNSVPIFFLGARPGVAERAADKLRERFAPSLNTFAHTGFFGSDGPENDALIETIRASGAKVLLVGMGMPLQELWIAKNHERLTTVNMCITVGALFDTLSGEVPRGPAWMTDHGFEWLARLLVEPGRLWRRYLLGNPLFVWNVLRQKFGYA